jgi:hypothetical protein
VPRAVNAAAFRVLDALFPMGALSRRAVSLAFRLLHPGEWLRGAAAAARSCARALLAAAAACLAPLRVFGRRRAAARRD